jgi:hypothetical protein
MAMEFIDTNNNDSNCQRNNTWFNIGLIALGALVAYSLLKNNQSSQNVQTQGTKYDNDESWHIQRGDEGFIDDVKVGRHANVGNGNYNETENVENIHKNYTASYISLGDNPIDKAQLDKYINGMIKNSLFQKINVDSINELLGNRRVVLSDAERRRRFGMN